MDSKNNKVHLKRNFGTRSTSCQINISIEENESTEMSMDIKNVTCPICLRIYEELDNPIVTLRFKGMDIDTLLAKNKKEINSLEAVELIKKASRDLWIHQVCDVRFGYAFFYTKKIDHDVFTSFIRKFIELIEETNNPLDYRLLGIYNPPISDQVYFPR